MRRLFAAAAVGSVLAGCAQTSNDWRRAVWQACEAEHAQLPTRTMAATSLVVEGAGLAETQVFQLLSERHLEYVEVRVAQKAEGGKRIGWPDCCRFSWPWGDANWATQAYVRLSLGKVSDAACRPELSERWKAPPFMPDTCLLAEEVTQPSASVRLDQKPATSPREWGWWRLAEVETGRVLAQLSSDTVRGDGAGGRRLKRDGDTSPLDCRNSQYVLVDMLRNPVQETRARSPQLISEVTVQPNISLAEIQGRASEWPKLDVSGQVEYLSEEQDWGIFSSEIRWQEWAAHVKNAKESPGRIARHGSRLIDLNNATLTRLNTGTEGHLKWWTHAAFNGFFVAKREGPDGERLLARFDRNGKLEWVVRIDAGSVPPSRAGRAFEFQGAIVEGEDLVLYDRGRTIQPGETRPPNAKSVVTAFRIPAKRLPPMEGQPLAR
jgi:hypothetical protein